MYYPCARWYHADHNPLQPPASASAPSSAPSSAPAQAMSGVTDTYKQKKHKYDTVEAIDAAILRYKDMLAADNLQEPHERSHKIQIASLERRKIEILDKVRKESERSDRVKMRCAFGMCMGVREDFQRGERVCIDCGRVHERSMISDEMYDMTSHREDAQAESRQRRHNTNQRSHHDDDSIAHKDRVHTHTKFKVASVVEPEPMNRSRIMQMLRAYADKHVLGEFDMSSAAQLIAHFQDLVNLGYDASGKKGTPKNITYEHMCEYVAGAVYGCVVFEKRGAFSEVSYRSRVCSARELSTLGPTESIQYERRYNKMVKTIVMHGKHKSIVPHMLNENMANEYMSAWFHHTILEHDERYKSIYGSSVKNFFATAINTPSNEWRQHAARAVRAAAEQQNVLASRVSKGGRKFMLGKISGMFKIALKTAVASTSASAKRKCDDDNKDPEQLSTKRARKSDDRNI